MKKTGGKESGSAGPNNRKLFVGNLTYSVRAGQLRELFSQFGEVVRVDVVEQKGYGFVEMKSPAEAQRAREALSEKEFEGRNLLIDGIRPPVRTRKKPAGQGTGGSSGGSFPRQGSHTGQSERYRGKKPGSPGGQGSSRPHARRSGSPGTPRRSGGARPGR